MTKQVVLISGANKGIGKEAAKQLAKQGFKVYIGSRDLERGKEAADELRKSGGDVEAIQLDVTDQKSVDSAVELLKTKEGHIDVLVNNAGILAERVTDIHATEIGAIEKTMQTNFFGAFRLLQGALPLLEKSPAPRVVNVSSSLGSLGKCSDSQSGFADFLYVGYGCSKAALNMLTVVASAALSKKGIKVNSVCPGYVATDINDNQGYRTVEQGAGIIVKLASLRDDGPTGGFFNEEGVVAW